MVGLEERGSVAEGSIRQGKTSSSSPAIIVGETKVTGESKNDGFRKYSFYFCMATPPKNQNNHYNIC
jgi:hypothetical protein